MKPLGSLHVVLKSFKDHFTFTKVTTHVRNILFGETYMDNVGDMKFKNHTTGDVGVLTLYPQESAQKVIYYFI